MDLINNSKFNWQRIFIAVVLIELVAILTDTSFVRLFTKPFLMPLLAAHFLKETKSHPSALKNWIVAALFLSWIGDLFLMLTGMPYFIGGIVFFLLAHLSYIVYYEKLLRLEKLNKTVVLFLPVLVYYAVLILFLAPYLGQMAWPVRIYGMIISIMLGFAFHTYKSSNNFAKYRMIGGAVLFISSDSLIAVTKFYQNFSYSTFWVMLTYCMAQYLICVGAINFITSSSPNSLKTARAKQ